jgi:hypothetical protein
MSYEYLPQYMGSGQKCVSNIVGGGCRCNELHSAEPGESSAVILQKLGMESAGSEDFITNSTRGTFYERFKSENNAKGTNWAGYM